MTMIVPGLIPDRGVMLAIGDAGAGKSLTAREATVAAGSGGSFCGHDVSKTSTLIIVAERERLNTATAVLGLAKHRGVTLCPEYVRVVGVQVEADDGRSASETALLEIKQAIRSAGGRGLRPGLVVVDPITCLFPDESLTPVEDIVKLVRLLAAQRFASVVTLGAHIARDGSALRHIVGAASVVAALDDRCIQVKLSTVSDASFFAAFEVDVIPYRDQSVPVMRDRRLLALPEPPVEQPPILQGMFGRRLDRGEAAVLRELEQNYRYEFSKEVPRNLMILAREAQGGPPGNAAEALCDFLRAKRLQ